MHELLTLSDEKKKEILFKILNQTDIPRNKRGLYDRTKPWIWRGAADRDGYGRIKINGKSMRVPRVIYALLHDALPPVVRHEDPTPADVNPYRLKGGDQLLNMQDRRRDGNNPVGERNGRAKLTQAQVKTIRQEAGSGVTQRSLATRFGVDARTIRDIVKRRTWKHV